MADKLLESIHSLRRASKLLDAGHPARAELERAMEILERTSRGPSGFRPYMFMVNAAREPMTLISREYVYDAVNDAFRRFAKGLVEEPVGRHVSEVWGESVFQSTIRPMLERCLAGEVVSYERWFRFPGNPRGYWEVTYYPYENASGRVTHAVVITRDLTAWHTAAESARKNEERYKSLVENINDVIFTTDRSAAVTYLAPSVEQLTGFDPEHYVGRPLPENVHPEDEPEVRRLLAPDQGRRVQDHDFRLKTRWGGHVWVRASARRADKGPDGSGLTGVLTDITESKLAARALRRSERKYRYIFENIQDVYFETSPGGRFLEVSPSVADISRYTREEMLGKSALDFFLDAGEQRAFRRALAAHGAVKDFAMRLRDRDGSVHVCSVSAKRMRDGDGGGYKVVGSMHDITRLKQIEEDMRRARVFLDHVLDTAPDPIFVKDESHHWRMVNQAFADLLGHAKGDLVNKSVRDFFDQEQAARFMAMDEEAFEKGSAIHEEEYWDQAGVWHVISTRKGVFDDPVRGERLLTGIVRDVTDQKRLEEALRLAKESAESLSEAKSRFLANMSHEVRTPLNGVMGMLQLALMGEMDEEQRDYLETALSSAKGLLTVINDILDLSKIEAGRLDMEAAEFDVRELVESVLLPMRQAAAERELSLSLALDQGVPARLSGAGSRIRQVLFNLVGNALKFTERGSVTVEVGYIPAHGSRDARLLMCVEDTGVGVSDEHMMRIFEDFTQGDESYTRQYQGAGLGLAIVRRLVELMGGTVSFMSERGSGSTVCFTVRVSAAQAGRTAPPGEGKTGRERAGFVRALVVEDNAVNRLLAERFLEKLSIRATGAANGQEALAALERGVAAGEPCDLVLLDIQMPVMDGMETVRRIRGHVEEAVSSAYVVALTAHAMEGDRERFLQAGMDAYVSKPLEYEDLRRVLSRAR